MSENKDLVAALNACKQRPAALTDQYLKEQAMNSIQRQQHDVNVMRPDRSIRVTVVAALLCDNNTIREHLSYSDQKAFDEIVAKATTAIQARRSSITPVGGKIFMAIVNGTPF